MEYCDPLYVYTVQSIEVVKYFDHVVGNYFDLIFSLGVDTEAMTERLRLCFDSISIIYKQSLHDTRVSRPDWSDSGYRCAYVYRFFHHSLPSCLYRSLQLSLLYSGYLLRVSWGWNPVLSICCIGGGPGSDVVGLTKFLRDSSPLFQASRVECTIIDLFQEWENSWRTITTANPNDFQLHKMTYMPGNILWTDSSLSPRGLLAVRSAHIITMVKFFSTVAAFLRRRHSHGNLLREIFQELRPGALVLYIDNLYNNQHLEFLDIAYSRGVREVLFEWHGEMVLPEFEHAKSISSIAKSTGFKPLQRCTVSILLLRKPDYWTVV